MKKTYIQPWLRYIALDSEDQILNASVRLSDTEEDTTDDSFDQRSSHKNLWGNEGGSIWK